MKKVLKRIFRALLCIKIKQIELRKYYLAMLHLERYLDRLNLL